VSFPSYFITKLIKGFASGTHGNTGPDEKDTPADDSAFQTPLAQRPNTDETGTRFLEINRDSAQFGRRFKIDQRIKVDDQGMYVPDYSPDTNSSEEDGRLSGEGLLSATTISSSSDSFHTPPQTATLPPDPRTTGPPPSAGLQAERNRHEQFDAEIAARRTEFIALNSEIEVLQQDTFAGISSGVSSGYHMPRLLRERRKREYSGRMRAWQVGRNDTLSRSPWSDLPCFCSVSLFND
jgi:hypothetical protein